MFYNNGDIFEGHYGKDKQNGKGVYKYNDGRKYEGDFKDDRIEGNGKLFYNNGDIYEGEFKNGEREGKGKVIFKIGIVFKGYYERDRPRGKGVLTSKDGEKYEGDFKDAHTKKKEIIERQFVYKIFESKINNINNQKDKIKEVLEDMCVLGSIMKDEIIEEKKNNPEKFISIEDALKEKNKNNGIFCLGILAKILEEMGITTIIEKSSSNDEEAQKASNTVLQFITNGMINKKKYDLNFVLGKERNNVLLYNMEEQKKFNTKLKKKLSLEYNIPEKKIIITNPQKGSYRVQVIFEADDFNDKYFDINTF